MFRHNGLTGSNLAEAETAAAVLSVTLTYADVKLADGTSGPPPNALHLTTEDVGVFRRSLRDAGWKVNISYSGEYGGATGRAHWHVMVYFHFTGDMVGKWESWFVDGNREAAEEMKQRWRDALPPVYRVRVDPWIEKPDFMALLNDPETLVVTEERNGDAKGKSDKYRNAWKFWKWGAVEAQLVKHPGHLDGQVCNEKVRYNLKYITKDPWKNSPEYRHTAFDELPEVIKEGTAFGPWLTDDDTGELLPGEKKWIRRNTFAEAFQERLLEEFASDDEVPHDRRLRKPVYVGQPRGGLGNEYFRAWGRRQGRALLTPDRRFWVPDVRGKANLATRAKMAAIGLSSNARSNQLSSFWATDTAFRAMLEGFNAESGKPEDWEDDKWTVDNMRTRRARDADRGSGALWSLWGKSDIGRRDALELIWSKLPDGRLSGIIPKRLLDTLENGPPGRVGDVWQDKRNARAFQRAHGYCLRRLTVGDAVLELSSMNVLSFIKYLDTGRLWWRRSLANEGELRQALGLAGEQKLLPPDAKIAALDRPAVDPGASLVGADRRRLVRLVEKLADKKFPTVSGEKLRQPGAEGLALFHEHHGAGGVVQDDR